MANDEGTKNYGTIFPDKTGDIPTGADLLSQKEAVSDSNPAIDEYYKSKSYRNVWVGRLSKVGTIVLIMVGIVVPIIVAIGMGVAGYYFTNLRDPLIRLEDKVDSIQSTVTTNSKDIDVLKKSIVPFAPAK